VQLRRELSGEIGIGSNAIVATRTGKRIYRTALAN
jgi:hypothetical protein